MSMNGRDFLQSARQLLRIPSEPNWRSATGRAYYALIHEARSALDRWGFPLPARENIHTFVRLRFLYAAHRDANEVGKALDDLSQWRNHADYRLAQPGMFATAARATQSVTRAENAIILLDTIEADPARRAAVIAAIRVAWP
jgi:hypothetical protein